MAVCVLLTRQQPSFDPAHPWGGNSRDATVDVNAQYSGFEHHYTYLVFCGFIVWLIIPGIGLLYGGLAHRKSALSLLFQSLMVGAVTTFQWMFWGVQFGLHRRALHRRLGKLRYEERCRRRAIHRISRHPGDSSLPLITCCSAFVRPRSPAAAPSGGDRSCRAWSLGSSGLRCCTVPLRVGH